MPFEEAPLKYMCEISAFPCKDQREQARAPNSWILMNVTSSCVRLIAIHQWQKDPYSQTMLEKTPLNMDFTWKASLQTSFHQTPPGMIAVPNDIGTLSTDLGLQNTPLFVKIMKNRLLFKVPRGSVTEGEKQTLSLVFCMVMLTLFHRVPPGCL